MGERFPDNFAVELLRGVEKPSLGQCEKMIARRARYLIRRIGELREAGDQGKADMLRKELASIVVIMDDVEKRTTRIRSATCDLDLGHGAYCALPRGHKGVHSNVRR